MPKNSNASGAILDHATQYASQHGVNGITIGGLAEAIGMSKGGVCAHFHAKHDLQMAVIAQAERLFVRAIFSEAQQHAPGLPRLQAMCEAWFAYIANRTFAGGCFFTNALLELDDSDDNALRAAVISPYERYLRWIEHVAAEAITQQHFRADADPKAFAFEFHGLQMATLLWRSLGRETDLCPFGRQQAQALFARYQSPMSLTS